MGKRRKERDESRIAWEKSGGKKTARELAAEFGVSEAMIRKWKSEDHWVLKKKRGGQPGNQNGKGKNLGNQNAKGHGGVQGNRNAQTHGAYAKPDTEVFTAGEISQVDLLKAQNALLGELMERKIYLRHRLEDLQQQEQEDPDRKILTGGIDGKNAIAYWDTPGKQRQVVELEYNRVVGKIQKIFDQVQVRESLNVHREISLKNLSLQREKAMGIFETEDPSSTASGGPPSPQGEGFGEGE